MEKEIREPTKEEPIKVNLIKDKKQMRVTIPAWIVENFNIEPERYQFGWFVQEIGKDKDNQPNVIVLGKFIHKKSNGKKH